MAPRASLKTFLTTARKALLSAPSPRPRPVTFVIGNESADLDSLCSAIALAYLRTYTPPHNRLHIPLANLYRPDLVLRPEFTAVLERAGVDADDVLTLSEFDQVDLKPEDTRWLLVDHNALTGTLKERFADRVVGCVDHHEDEGLVPKDTGDEPRAIEKCGSCMSMVIASAGRAWTDNVEQMSKEGQGEVNATGDKDRDVQLAYLVLAPILIDTTNLQSKDKTEPIDAKIVEHAEQLFKVKDVAYSRDRYHEELASLKEDLSSLSYRDIYRKDYKKWKDGGLVLGTSSVSQGVQYLLEKIGDKDELLAELKKWAVEEGLDIACIFTTSHIDGVFARDLLVWGLNERAVRVVKEFVDRNGERLGLETWGDGELNDTSSVSQWRACWKQLRTENSRKQVAPMLREAMREGSR